MAEPYYTNLAEEITWFLHINDRERIKSCTASEWRKEANGVIARILADHGIENIPT